MRSHSLDRIDRGVLSIMYDDLRAAEHEVAWADMPTWVRPWYDAEVLIAEHKLDDAVRAFRAALAEPGLPFDARFRLTSGLANALHDLGDMASMREALESIDIDALPLAGYVGRVARLAAEGAANEGRYVEAIALGERAVAGYSSGPYDAALGNALTELATFYNRVGRLTDSIRCQYRAYDAYDASGIALARAIALINLGVIFGEIGNKLEAREYFATARGIPLTHGGERIELWCALNLGLLALERDDAQGAIGDLTTAQRLGSELRMWSTVIGAERGLAAAHRMLGDHELAQTHLTRTRELLGQHPNEALSITTEVEQARLEHAMHRHTVALQIAEPLLTDARNRQDVSAMVRLLEIIADAQAALHNYEQAYHARTELMQLRRLVEDESTQQQIAALKVDQELRAERASAARERALLRGLLPESIARRLIAGESRIADVHQHVCVLFADIVGFTSMADDIPAAELIDLLGEIFTLFDEIVTHHGLIRIKTIGDAYMAIANAPDPHADPIMSTATCALDMQRTLAAVRPDLSIRIGLHCGDVVAGVIGKERPMFDVWGDTVNVASRMESSGEPGRIHVSEAFAHRLTPCLTDSLTLVQRGEISIKGKGPMTTYWLECPLP